MSIYVDIVSLFMLGYSWHRIASVYIEQFNLSLGKGEPKSLNVPSVFWRGLESMKS